jgi:hypothetical protein
MTMWLQPEPGGGVQLFVNAIRLQSGAQDILPIARVPVIKGLLSLPSLFITQIS